MQPKKAGYFSVYYVFTNGQQPVQPVLTTPQHEGLKAIKEKQEKNLKAL